VSLASIKWFAPLLSAIAHTASKRGLDLRITVFVTCLCVPEEVPDIPGMEVRVGGRPDMSMLVRRMLGQEEVSEEIEKGVKEKGKRDVESARGGGGGQKFEGRLGICASGPASLTTEVANAVARLAGTRGGGRVGLHTEVFAI
jgi:ferric-chelate reductase